MKALATTSIDIDPRWRRLSHLRLNDNNSLVMDRGNGRWVIIDNSGVPLLGLLSTSVVGIDPDLQSIKKQFEDRLLEVGLGGPEYIANSDLNTLIVKLTNACNYACSYCYDFEEGDNVRHLDAEVAISAISQALDITPTSLHVLLHGGEPTLRFDTIKQVVRAGEALADGKGKKIVFSGQTNLSRLCQEIVDFSNEHNVVWGISLDGPPTSNDKFRVLRDGTGTYHHFTRALKEFPEFVRKCGVLTTVTSATDTRLLEIARYFRDLDMISWDWTLFQPIGRGRNAAATLDFSVESLIKSWNELFDALEKGEFLGFQVKPILHYLKNFFSGPGSNMCMRKGCGAARDLLSLSVDGTIEACDCIDPKGPLSNLGLVQISSTTSMREARESDTAKLIRSRKVELGGCEDCIWLSNCGGTCLAHADSIHGIWSAQCAVAMNAFDRIAKSIAKTNCLRAYMESVTINA